MVSVSCNKLSNRQPIVQVCEEEKDKRQDLYIKARSYQASLDEHHHKDEELETIIGTFLLSSCWRKLHVFVDT